jgi:hypothetical protein
VSFGLVSVHKNATIRKNVGGQRACKPKPFSKFLPGQVGVEHGTAKWERLCEIGRIDKKGAAQVLFAFQDLNEFKSRGSVEYAIKAYSQVLVLFPYVQMEIGLHGTS